MGFLECLAHLHLDINLEKETIEIGINIELPPLFFSFRFLVDCSGFSFHPLIRFAILSNLQSHELL